MHDYSLFLCVIPLFYLLHCLPFISKAPYDVEKDEGVEGESAQSCGAHLERHPQTAE